MLSFDKGLTTICSCFHAILFGMHAVDNSKNNGILSMRQKWPIR